MTLRNPELDFHIGPMRPEEASAVAQLHYSFFGTGAMHGTTIASFGPEFLEAVFYRLNLDNPYLFVDVARYQGEVVAFSVYASNRKRVFRETLRRHFSSVLVHLLKIGLRRPFPVMRHVFSNLQFLTERLPEAVRKVPAWFFLLGVKPEYRNRQFRQRTGIWVAGELWKHMESNLQAQGCEQFWTVVGAHNEPMNQLHRLFGMELVARGMAQGLLSNFYRRSLGASQK